MTLRQLVRSVLPMYRRDYKRRRILVHRTAQLLREERMEIGEYVRIGPRCHVSAQGGLRIGAGTVLAPEVVILTSNHDYRSGELLPFDHFDVLSPVTIGRGVWIGYRAMVAPGVTIGDGAIVGMGSVVIKDVGPGRMVFGTPARDVGEARPDHAELVAKEAWFHRRYWGERPRIEVV